MRGGGRTAQKLHAAMRYIGNVWAQSAKRKRELVSKPRAVSKCKQKETLAFFVSVVSALRSRLVKIPLRRTTTLRKRRPRCRNTSSDFVSRLVLLARKQ